MADKPHHIWCNYWTGPQGECNLCKRLFQRFPYTNESPEDMMAKHFPDVEVLHK